MAMQRLKDAAEKAKCDLSSLNTTEINLPFIANDANGAAHLNVDVDARRPRGPGGRHREPDDEDAWSSA